MESEKKPLFELEEYADSFPCDSCGTVTKKGDKYFVLSANRTGSGLALCGTCLNKLKNLLDKKE
jgi:hypothetical protein